MLHGAPARAPVVISGCIRLLNTRAPREIGAILHSSSITSGRSRSVDGNLGSEHPFYLLSVRRFLWQQNPRPDGLER